MADIDYSVAVAGLKDLKELDTRIKSLDSLLRKPLPTDGINSLASALKNLGSSGSGASDKVAEEVAKLRRTTNDLKNVFRGVGDGLASTLKTELAKTAGSIRNDVVLLGEKAMSGFGDAAAKSVAAETKKITGAANKARAEMTAAYNKLVGEDGGLKNLNVDQLGIVKSLRDQGAAISKYHTELIRQMEASSKQTLATRKRLADQEVQALAAQAKQTQQELAQISTWRAKSAPKLTEDDARALLGVPSRAEMSGFAARLKAEIQAQQKSLYANGKGSVANATANASGMYTDLSSMRMVRPAIKAADEAERALKKTREEAAKLNGGFKELTVSGGDLHSMARGLSSGFGALWLTWGNLLPLMAGAALSNGFMKTAKEGMEVANTFEIIKRLGENTDTEIKQLRDRLVDLGNSGIHGPQELASAMQTLSLAGMKANEILGVTADVMNFSMAGTTSIENAADVLVSVTTAFGTGAEGFQRTADIIMRAAADSKASVESFGEAMKTASVVGEQYGAKQEDVALQIEYLANLGIQGSAAGTAIRNMYADITGRSGQVTKILKSLGMDFKDVEGNVLGVEEMTKQLYDTLSKYDTKSQGNILQGIFGERGAKAAVALMAEYKKSAEDGSKYTNKLAEDLGKLKNAAGDSAIAAAYMGETAKNAFKAASATFETTLYKAFETIEPQLYLTAKAMKEAFGSQELQTVLNGIVTAVATLTQYVAENSQSIAAAIAIYAGYRAALALVGSGIAAAATVKEAWTAVTARATASTVANTAALEAQAIAASAAARATAAGATAQAAAGAATASTASLVLRAVPIVGNVIAGAAVAWSLYDMWASKSNNTTDVYVNTKADAIADKLNKESDHLKNVNDLRATGLSLKEAEARLDAAKSKQAIDASYAEATAAASARQTKLLGGVAQINELEASGTATSGDLKRKARIEKELAEVNEVIAKAENERVASQAKVTAAEMRYQEEVRRSNDINEKEAERRKKLNDVKFPSGSKSWNLADFQAGQGGKFGGKGGKFGGKGGDTFERANLERDNELKALEAFYNARSDVVKSAYDKESKFLDMRREGEIISESEYMNQSFALATKYENDRIKLAQDKSEAYLTAYAARQDRMRKAMEAASDPMVKDQYKQQMQKEMNDAKAFTEKTTAEIEKIKIDSNARVEQSFIKLESTAYKLIKTDKDFWEKRKRDTARSDEAKALEKAYENINTSVFSTEQAEYARAKAVMEVNHATQEHIQELKKQVSIQEAILAGLQAEFELRMQMPGQDAKTLQEMSDSLNRVRETITRLRTQMANAINKGTEEGTAAGGKAFTEQMEKQARETRNVLTDSIVTALMEGGSAGGKKLRDFLQQELIRKPLTVLINGVLNGIFGGGGGMFGSLLGGLFGGNSGSGGGSGAFGLASNAYSAYGMMGYNPMMANVLSLFGVGGSAGAAFGTTAYANAVGWLGGDSLGAFIAANGGWQGTAVGAGAANGAGSGAGGMGAGSWAMAIPLVAAYLGGMFKDEKMVGQGITGDLGGNLYGYQLMRESGGLFDGPDYRYVIAEKEIAETKAKIKELQDNNPYASLGERGNARRDYELQGLYNKLDVLERNYGAAIEGSKGPIKLLQTTFESMRESTAKQADVLGLNGDAIRKMTVTLGLDEIHPDTGGKGLELTGLTQEEASAKIQKALESANEEMARSVLGTWKEVTREVTTVVWDTVLVDNGGDTETYARVAREVKETITEQVWEMSKYVHEGETAVQALGRLSTSLTTVNGWLEAVNGTLYETSLAGADMASQLIDAFGGAEAFTTATTTYFDQFFSTAEKAAYQTKMLNKQFGDMGMTMPATREAYKALLESQDLTTEEGRKTYAALLKLAGVLDAVYDSAEAAAEAMQSVLASLEVDLLRSQGKYKEATTIEHNQKLEELRKTGGQAAVDAQLWIWYNEAQNYLRKQEIDILRASGKELEAVALEREMELKQISVYGDEAVANQKKLWALQDQAKARAEAEAALEKKRQNLYDNLAAAVERERKGVEKVRDETQKLIDDLNSVVDAARNASRELYNTIERTAQKQTEEARATIADILATLKAGGKAPNAQTLNDAITQSRVGLSSENFLTEYEYQRQTLVLAGQLAQIGELTDGSLTIEEQALEALNKQIEQFDTTLEYYQKQLGLAEDGIDATLTVAQAVSQIEDFLRNKAATDAAEKAKEEAKNPSGGTTTPTSPWTGNNTNPDTGGPKLGGIESGSPRTYVIGYDSEGRAHYSDGSVGTAKAGEYIYNDTGNVSAAGITMEQWNAMKNGGEPFGGYWMGGKYNTNGRYKWDDQAGLYVPSFDVGINRLPHDTLAYLHKDEAVVPAKYNEFNPNAAKAGNTDQFALEKIYEVLYSIAGISTLSAEIQQKTLDILDDVSEGGNAFRNEMMNPEEIAKEIAKAIAP